MAELTRANERSYRSWQRSRRAEGYAERDSNKHALTLLQHHAGGADLLELGRADILDWLTGEGMQGLAESSRKTYFSNARAFYNWASSEEEQLLDRSPMARMREPKVRDVPTEIPPDADMQLLLKTCEADRTPQGRRDNAVIRVMADTGGPRATELVTMALHGHPEAPEGLGLDLDHDRITVRGKGGMIRTWPVAARTGRAVDRWIRDRDKMPGAGSPWLWLPFRAKPGTTWTRSGLQKMIARRCTDAGIKVLHPHQIRHFSWHHYLLAGGTIEDGMRLYGWTDDTMPRHYARFLADARAIKHAGALAIGDQW